MFLLVNKKKSLLLPLPFEYALKMTASPAYVLNFGLNEAYNSKLCFRVKFKKYFACGSTALALKTGTNGGVSLYSNGQNIHKIINLVCLYII